MKATVRLVVAALAVIVLLALAHPAQATIFRRRAYEWLASYTAAVRAATKASPAVPS